MSHQEDAGLRAQDPEADVGALERVASGASEQGATELALVADQEPARGEPAEPAAQWRAAAAQVADR
jgi:hypothetical protein